MNEWNRIELDEIAAADELDIASVRPDGTLRPYTTIWVVRVGDDLYVRSYAGGAAGGSGTRCGATEVGSAPAASNATSRSRSRKTPTTT